MSPTLRGRSRYATSALASEICAGVWSFRYPCWRTVPDAGVATIGVGRVNLPNSVEHFGPNLTRTFVYDALGARVKKRQDANNEVHYVTSLYEGRNLTAQSTKESVFRFVAEGTVVAERVHTWGGTSRSTRHIYSDIQDTPAFVVVGTTSTQLGFFPYGKRMNVAPATPPAQTFSQLGYTGHRHDDDIGLINMNGRVYDITTRRFLTPDPVLDQPFTTFGTQPYSYVAHNPTNFTDPTGLYAGRDNRWFSQSLVEAQQAQSFTQCPGGSTYCFPDDILTGKPPREETPESAPPPVEPQPAERSWSRGIHSAGRSWVTTNPGSIQQLSSAQSGLVSPTSLGNLGGARSYGGNSPSALRDARSGMLATIPHLQCDSFCVATGGGLGPGSFMINGPRAASAGLTLLDKLRTLLGLGPAARAIPKIHLGQQGKHILGHPNFIQGRSILKVDPARLAQRAGTGTPVNNVARGQPGFRERVDFGEVIGDFVKDGVATPTSRGIIHYGKEGIHIVPAAP